MNLLAHIKLTFSETYFHNLDSNKLLGMGIKENSYWYLDLVTH